MWYIMKQLRFSSSTTSFYSLQWTPGSGTPGGHLGAPGHNAGHRPIDPWAPLNCSRKSLPPFKQPSTYRTCSILDMRQLLEDWLNKSTFAIATWRGDAQRYWLEQVETAEVCHDQWLQSSPDQRNSLEPAYILGVRNLQARTRIGQCSCEHIANRAMSLWRWLVRCCYFSDSQCPCQLLTGHVR